MIFYFKDDVYELSKEHNEMRRWLTAQNGSEPNVAKTWCFLRAYGSFSSVPPFDRIIFTDPEDAAMFKLKYGNIISKTEG